MRRISRNADLHTFVTCLSRDMSSNTTNPRLRAEDEKLIQQSPTPNAVGRVGVEAKIVDGSEGHVVCEIPVSTEVLNGAGALHGGAIATIVDSVSTWAVVSVGNNVPGVSIELSVSYIKAAFPGDTLKAEARTSHVGGRLAFLTVDITNKDTGVLLAQGKHTKYMSVPKTQKPQEKS